LTVDDLLRLEEFGEVALSPDGRWLAYVVKRPRSMARFHKHDFWTAATAVTSGSWIPRAGCRTT